MRKRTYVLTTIEASLVEKTYEVDATTPEKARALFESGIYQRMTAGTLDSTKTVKFIEPMKRKKK